LNSNSTLPIYNTLLQKSVQIKKGIIGLLKANILSTKMDSPVSNISALHGITIRWLHNYSGSTHYPKENSI
jgi:hemerythrin-like domain-containing protein